MRLIFYESIASTQLEALKILEPNTCIATHCQTHGIGSRENSWDRVESGLYFSLIIEKKSLPDDLKPQSIATYVGFHFKECVKDFTSKKLFLKWPNDLYVYEKNKSAKIGGVLVNIKGDFIVCGIGINYLSKEHASLEKKLDSKRLLIKFANKIIPLGKKRSLLSKKREKSIKKHQKAPPSWRQTLRKYRLEFAKSHPLSTNFDDVRLDLSRACLQRDGSITIDNKRFFGRVACVK